MGFLSSRKRGLCSHCNLFDLVIILILIKEARRKVEKKEWMEGKDGGKEENQGGEREVGEKKEG